MSEFQARAEHIWLLLDGNRVPALLLGVEQQEGRWRALVASAHTGDTRLVQEWVDPSVVVRLDARSTMHTAPPPKP